MESRIFYSKLFWLDMRFFSLSLKNKILPEKNFESLLKKNFLFLKYWTGPDKKIPKSFSIVHFKKNEKKFFCSKKWIFFPRRNFLKKKSENGKWMKLYFLRVNKNLNQNSLQSNIHVHIIYKGSETQESIKKVKLSGEI